MLYTSILDLEQTGTSGASRRTILAKDAAPESAISSKRVSLSFPLVTIQWSRSASDDQCGHRRPAQIPQLATQRVSTESHNLTRSRHRGDIACFKAYERSRVGCVAQWYNVGLCPANFPVLRSTCSWRVTTCVGRPSAIGQFNQPGKLSLSFLWGSINE